MSRGLRMSKSPFSFCASVFFVLYFLYRYLCVSCFYFLYRYLCVSCFYFLYCSCYIFFIVFFVSVASVFFVRACTVFFVISSTANLRSIVRCFMAYRCRQQAQGLTEITALYPRI